MDCYSCRPVRPAAYIWTASPSGNEIPLCVECCALWRADVTEPEYRDYSPAQIRSIEAAI